MYLLLEAIGQFLITYQLNLISGEETKRIVDKETGEEQVQNAETRR